MKELKILCAVGVFVVALSGCKSKPSPVDNMRQRASDVKEMVDLANQLAKDSERGPKLVQSREKKVNPEKMLPCIFRNSRGNFVGLVCEVL